MENLLQQLNEWEIRLLVLLSFILQMLLFFTGGLRLRSRNTPLRFCMWIAYLGADLVAVYALGLLSRHKDAHIGKEIFWAAHPLAFLWAPFLLMHLGGQDTITAFAIEDNNLWLRHLLNLVVQVGLALYVFWESVGHSNVVILVPGIFVFTSGIIKYGERTLALMYGNLKGINSSSEIDLNLHEGYFGIISSALKSTPGIRVLFEGRTLSQMEERHREALRSKIDQKHLPKLLEIELNLMYDDIYTKAMVLRSRSGIMLRCVSQVSMVVAFVLFTVNKKHRYSTADVAITYMLFTGGLCLEACAIFILLMSPRTWAWLEARGYHRLSRISSFLLYSKIGRPEGRPLWSNCMGQYNFLSYVDCDVPMKSKLVKKVARMMVSIAGVGDGKSFLWLSKLLDSKHIEVDKEIMDSIVVMVDCSDGSRALNPEDWPNLGSLIEKLVPDFGASFGYGIVCFHIFTETHLRKYYHPQDFLLVGVCRKLSNYMLYLLVTHPEMLPVSGTTEPTMIFFLDKITSAVSPSYTADRILSSASSLLQDGLGLHQPEQRQETLREIRDLWTRLLLFAAGKSRADMHAAQLSRGGELLTFAWLLMAHKGGELLTFAWLLHLARRMSRAAAITVLKAEHVPSELKKTAASVGS
ncbi:hypothetical protein CFC21_004036 [Triticum aestivum]|uniref:DUF4220 domain-containing protein n=1 Tax=Triticum aestivum TaxID=4565 RepID=A0A3B5Y5Y7_WHEAT|nr:uncharacterized protein LOC123181227 [Triticum aestivum]XP_044449425.1 uncharacterized protein LOC123181227 [Triticum aestivum]KAF6986252.1 hypothetical protein CFC21_004036 [Triticum aestivum]